MVVQAIQPYSHSHVGFDVSTRAGRQVSPGSDVQRTALRFATMALAVVAIMASASRAIAQTTRPAPQPTKITVNVTDVSPAEAAAAIAKAGGPALFLGENPKVEKVTLNHTDAPALDVLADFFRQAKVSPQTSHNGPGIGCYAYESLRIERPSPTVLAVIRSAQTNGVAMLELTDPAHKLRYEQTLSITFIIDLSANVVGVSDRVLVDEVVYPNADFRKNANDGYHNLSRMDGQPFGVFESVVRLIGNERIRRIDKLGLRVRAWQAAERAKVVVEVAQLYNGGQSKADNLTVTTEPAAEDGTVRFKLTGPLLAMYRQHPWQPGLARCVVIEGASGPIANIRCELVQRGGNPAQEPTAEIHLAGPRQFAGKSATVDDIDRVRIEIPTKVRLIDIPLELRDIALP